MRLYTHDSHFTFRVFFSVTSINRLFYSIHVARWKLHFNWLSGKIYYFIFSLFSIKLKVIKTDLFIYV